MKYVFFKKDDSSFAFITSRPLLKSALATKGTSQSERISNQALRGVYGVVNSHELDEAPERHLSGRHNGGEKIKYNATQVVVREGGDPDRKLPIGTSFIGQLVTGIDTREPNPIVRVTLPYGASFDHDRRIDKGSTLFGVASYPGSGEKVYVKFTRLLFPDGREFKIEAQALSSADYSPGLAGVEHEDTGGRMASTVGLTMASGMSEVLVQKEALSAFGTPTAKSNLKNAFFNGLNKATQNEIERRTAKENEDKDYVTVAAGRDVIVSLIETFKGESF